MTSSYYEAPLKSWIVIQYYLSPHASTYAAVRLNGITSQLNKIDAVEVIVLVYKFDVYAWLCLFTCCCEAHKNRAVISVQYTCPNCRHSVLGKFGNESCFDVQVHERLPLALEIVWSSLSFARCVGGPRAGSSVFISN